MRSARLFPLLVLLAVAALSNAPLAVRAQDPPPIVDTFARVDTMPLDTVVTDTAVVADTAKAGFPLPDTRSSVNWLLTVLMAIVTPKIMSLMERLFARLNDQSPAIKQLIVSAIPAIVMYVAAVASHFWPWFPWEPSLGNAVAAGIGAWSVHAGLKSRAASQTASEALKVAHQTREMQGR
jgi:hypothetical protein